MPWPDGGPAGAAGVGQALAVLLGVAAVGVVPPVAHADSVTPSVATTANAALGLLAVMGLPLSDDADIAYPLRRR